MEKIAIIGLSCVFPDAHSVEEYWQNLIRGKNAATQATEDQFGVDPSIFQDPEKGKTDKYDNPVEDRVYNTTDYDRNLVIDERTQVVAAKVTEFLAKHDRFDKTIIFCVDIEHAQRMRAAIANANPDLVIQDSRYVMQITGDN